MSKNIFVGNLPYAITEGELEELFAQHGQVGRAQIIIDRETGRSKGFGFIEMPNDDEAQKAMDALNGHDMGGRKLQVNEARPREERPRGSFGGGGGGGGGGFGGGGGGGGRGGYGGGGGGGRGGYGGGGGGGRGGYGGGGGGGGVRGGGGGGGGAAAAATPAGKSPGLSRKLHQTPVPSDRRFTSSVVHPVHHPIHQAPRGHSLFRGVPGGFVVL
jgi:hypothetical protein